MNMNLRRWPALVLEVQLLFIFAESKNTMKIKNVLSSNLHIYYGVQISKFDFFCFLFQSQLWTAAFTTGGHPGGWIQYQLGTKIIIHGFRALGTKPSWIDALIQAFLKVAKVNVIAVDWVQGATAAYPTAVENVMKLGLEISSFIRKLLAMGVPESSIHLIGVSLGAHVGAWWANSMKATLEELLVSLYHTITCCPPNSPNEKCNWLLLIVPHVSALDPAGPKYTRASPEERLDPGDALFVEAIHTDSDNFGIRIPVGHIDYYLNGGKDQPGCPRFILSGYQYLICDHLRAVHFYISVLKDSCPMMAFPCSSYKNFLAGHCLDCSNPFLLSCPTIGLLDNGGLNIKMLPREVKVYLATAASAPYCVHHTLVEFHLQRRRTSDTNIEITFLTSNSSTSTSFIIPKQQMLGKGLLIHSVPLCQIESVMLQHLHKFWKRNKDEPPIVGHFCTASLPVDKNEKMMCLPQVLTITSHNPFFRTSTFSVINPVCPCGHRYYKRAVTLKVDILKLNVWR